MKYSIVGGLVVYTEYDYTGYLFMDISSFVYCCCVGVYAVHVWACP